MRRFRHATDLPPCDTRLLIRAAEMLIADKQRVMRQTAVVVGTARFTCLVSEMLRSKAQALCLSAAQRQAKSLRVQSSEAG